LITHHKGSSLDGVLSELVQRLHAIKLLTDDLTVSGKDFKYFGVCKVPEEIYKYHRRIDFQLIPLEEWPCALLYFTGSDHFNRSMRLWARKNGMSLSEKSLVVRVTEDMKGKPIPVSSEEDVFKALGLEYVPPEKRSV